MISVAPNDSRLRTEASSKATHQPVGKVLGYRENHAASATGAEPALRTEAGGELRSGPQPVCSPPGASSVPTFPDNSFRHSVKGVKGAVRQSARTSQQPLLILDNPARSLLRRLSSSLILSA